MKFAIESLKTIYDELKREYELISQFNKMSKRKNKHKIYGEFDPGSGLTLAACLIHASRMVSLLTMANG